MYQDGILPIEVVYDYLKKAEVIPDWLELEEFKKLLASKNSFPNNPDAEANSRGFKRRKTERARSRLPRARRRLLRQARSPKSAGAGVS